MSDIERNAVYIAFFAFVVILIAACVVDGAIRDLRNRHRKPRPGQALPATPTRHQQPRSNR